MCNKEKRNVMDMKKKIWIVLMAAVMLLTVMSVSAYAEEDPVVPVKAEWDSFFTPRGVIGTHELFNLETPDIATFNIEFSDGTTKRYIYKEFVREEGTPGEYVEQAFYPEGEDIEELGFYPEAYEDQDVLKEGKNKLKLQLKVPYVASGKGTDEEVIDYAELETEVDVLCVVEKPLKVEFIPAADFTPKWFIGINWLTEASFFGEGNAFRVTYQTMEDGAEDYSEYTTTYLYAKGKDADGDDDEGFFPQGRMAFDRFEFDGKEVNLERGTNEVEFEYSEYITELDDEVVVPFTVAMDVQKYDAYASFPIYDYTGKVISPKFKVYNSDDDLLSSKKYTFAAPKNKKMGWYDVEITFKDEFKNDFVNPSFTASYGIGPKMPVIKKVTGGKKSLTVVWKKLTKSQLKNVDVYVIDIAKDKNFMKAHKTYKLKSKDIKAGKKVLKKLSKGKKYYVQMYALKKIKQNGTTFQMPSELTKVKSAKTK